jgi:hypothetical protein
MSPGKTRSLRVLVFQERMAATLVPYRLLIELRVSPFFTV